MDVKIYDVTAALNSSDRHRKKRYTILLLKSEDALALTDAITKHIPSSYKIEKAVELSNEDAQSFVLSVMDIWE